MKLGRFWNRQVLGRLTVFALPGGGILIALYDGLRILRERRRRAAARSAPPTE